VARSVSSRPRPPTPTSPVIVWMRRAAAVAGHVAGRHRHEVRSHAEVLERGDDARRAEEVDLDGAVEGRVEGDGGGGVDDHGARRQDGAVRLVEAEAVGADVAGDHLDPPGHQFVDGLGPAGLGAEAVEGVVADDLALHPLGGGGPATGPDQQDQLAAGYRAHEALHDGGAEEPGGAGDGDALAGQGVGDHDPVFTMW